jgi:hypothetical protein
MGSSTRRLTLLAGLFGLVAIIGDILSNSSHFVVARPERALLSEGRAAVHEEMERLEGIVPAGREGQDDLWRAYLDVFEKQREEGRRDAAIRILYDAYGAALESRSWESMIAVGDGFMAMGRAPGSVAGARMNARQAYLTALIRARRAGSVEGALRSAQAFEELPDRDVVEQCLYIAAVLAAGDEQAQKKVRDAQERWAARHMIPES